MRDIMMPNIVYKIYQMLFLEEIRSHKYPIIIFLTYIISEYVVPDGGWLKNIIEVTIILFCSIYTQQIIFLVVKLWKKMSVDQNNDHTNGNDNHDIDNHTLSDELIA